MTTFIKAKNNLLKWVFGCCFLLLGAVSFGQSIETKIDRKDILIGEQINYSLQFTLPSQNFQIEFSVPDSLPHFEILHKSKSDSTDKAGNYLVTQRMVITSFDSGSWTLPALPMKIRNSSNQAVYSLNADPVTINVGYMPTDSSGALRDIKLVFKVFYIENDWWFWAIGIALALLLLYLIIRYFRNRPKKVKEEAESKLSAIEEARQKLDKLKKEEPGNLPELKIFYSTLSETFKKYYSRTYRSKLINKTTAQTLMDMQQNKIAPDVVSETAALLRLADAVKFAKYNPSYAENKDALIKMASVIETLHRLPQNN